MGGWGTAVPWADSHWPSHLLRWGGGAAWVTDNSELSCATSDLSFFICKTGDGPLHIGPLWGGEWTTKNVLEYSPKPNNHACSEFTPNRMRPRANSPSSEHFWRGGFLASVHKMTPAPHPACTPPAVPRHSQGGDGSGQSRSLDQDLSAVLFPPLQ